MFAQSKWDIGHKIYAPDGGEEVVIGVRLTSVGGKLEECYLLTNQFIWYTIQELMECNNGK